jgi:hypothetical protein
LSAPTVGLVQQTLSFELSNTGRLIGDAAHSVYTNAPAESKWAAGRRALPTI